MAETLCPKLSIDDHDHTGRPANLTVAELLFIAIGRRLVTRIPAHHPDRPLTAETTPPHALLANPR
ncbi:hypothetical protein ACTD5D_30625 [Nocardia takedensis]|uniref:hypothetical protein n=1 Tax=Nocardia takedensis TaxID=259390 RepID=UPI0002D86ED0|nr:hypothetical protein [Nocardia takedensis]